MKFNNSLKFALLRLRDKNSRRTIVGMSLALIMIIPLIWLVFSFYFDFQKQSNVLSVNNLFLVERSLESDVDYRSSEYESFLKSYGGVQLKQEQFADITNDSAVSWREFVFNYEKDFAKDDIEMIINGKNIGFGQEALKFKFINNGEVKAVPNSIEDYIKKHYNHSAVYGEKFSENKRELYISEMLLDSLGLEYSAVLGTTMSLSVNYKDMTTEKSLYIYDDDNNSGNLHIRAKDKSYQVPKINGKVGFFSDYKIVGVISKEYYEINELTSQDAGIWMKDTSLILDNGQPLLPRFSVQKIHSDFNFKNMMVITQNSNDFVNYSSVVAQNGCFYPLFVGNFYLDEVNNSNNIIMPVQKSYVQYDSYKSAKNISSKFENFVNHNGKTLFYAPYSSSFGKLLSINKTFNIITIVVAIVGGITAIAIALSFAKFICFNAQKRNDYLSMTNKTSINEKEKNYLLLTETLLIFLISLLIAVVVSSIIVVIIKAIFAKIISGYLLGLSLKFSYFFVAFLLVFLSFGALFSLIAIFANKEKKPFNIIMKKENEL